MPGFVLEQYGSRENTTGRNASATHLWMIGRTDDEVEVLAALLDATPAVYLGLVRVSTSQQPIGAGWWTAQVKYSLYTRQADQPNNQDKTSANDPLTPDVKIHIGSQNQHFTQSLYTVSKTIRTDDARQPPDFKGAIGVSRQGGQAGSIEGCDFPVPLMEWTETWTFLARYVTHQYIDDVTRLVGRTNKDLFRNKQPGEVMFMGMDSDAVGTDKRKLVYAFKRQPQSVFNLTGEGAPAYKWPSVTKKGWEYVWVDYEAKPAASKDAITMQPRCVYVERVGRPGLNDGPNGVGGNPTNEDDFTGVLKIGA